MKNILVIVLITLLSTSMAYGKISKGDVQKLVSKVCGELKKGAAKPIFDKITAGEHPYKNKDNPAFYVFVYNTKVEIVAHPKKKLVGKSYKGKADVKGNKFRDKIVSGALKNKSGWQDYVYQKPGTRKILPKTAFYKLCKSEKTEYIVASGIYKD